MSSYPKVECGSSDCCLANVQADPVSPLDMANYILELAVRDLGYSRGYLKAIVYDVNAIPCKNLGQGFCRRYVAIDDALAELGVYDNLVDYPLVPRIDQGSEVADQPAMLPADGLYE